MPTHPLAGQPVPADRVPDIPRLLRAYYTDRPEPDVASHRVAFGTSGHRGSALHRSFNEPHILAITEAICRYRKSQNINGPLFLGRDTHALSEPAQATALQVLAAHGVTVLMDDGYVPTPALSHAILVYNHGRHSGLADGILLTPSHNPPTDGGIKYNPPHGGPADTAATKWIEREANQLLRDELDGVLRISYERALDAGTTRQHDFQSEYVLGLAQVLDLDAIRQSGVTLAVDPLGGAGVHYWQRIADEHRLDLRVLSTLVDPLFRFMRLDWDGQIRMDCSSPHAMAGLIEWKDQFPVACACDTDHDRHGIVTRTAGLMNPNHYLAVAIDYLFRHRAGWRAEAGIGKTLVSSSLIDRVAQALGRPLVEVPVGFKWFVRGLQTGTLGFGGEESAGASFLTQTGGAWSTDKDGLILGLLAAEITARTGRDPSELYQALTAQHGEPVYERKDAPATPEQKAALGKLEASDVQASALAGERITQILTEAPGNQEPLGGLKVCTANGWFAARPSGTENVYKIYAESFLGREHLTRIQDEAQELVTRALQ
jgi:phosphoglucomutase